MYASLSRAEEIRQGDQEEGEEEKHDTQRRASKQQATVKPQKDTEG